MYHKQIISNSINILIEMDSMNNGNINLNEIEDDIDNYNYEITDEFLNINQDEDADLAEVIAMMQLKNNSISSSQDSNTINSNFNDLEPRSTITQVRPSVVDDFIRNFMIQAGLSKSFEVFNTEWFEMQSKGRLPPELSHNVPDIYLRNEELQRQIDSQRSQIEKMKDITNRAQSTWDKFRKERDYHRMHHRQVIQEKEKLLTDIKRMKEHMKSYEPTIDELKHRYETMIKEKSLAKIENDRLKNRIKGLEEQLLKYQNQENEKESPTTKRSAARPVRKHAVFPNDSLLDNPYLNVDFDVPDVSSFQIQHSYQGHDNSISACRFHPKKPIFATASDDETWKLWTLSNCELVMAGEGHTGWLSDLHFHPHGSHLATSSGDGTLKIWEFSQARCSQTFPDHTQAVWGCEFHSGGDFLASCSMDHTVRIWDLIAGKCRHTLRGHVDSVNAICWQPFTANICSASGDKTVSVWDGRSGLCVQTLYGHANSCNDISVSNRGDVLYSADADGIIKIWDIRMVQELATIDAGQYPINKLAHDRGSHRLLAASDDATIKVINLDDFTMLAPLIGHEGPVQSIAFAPNDAYVVSGSSDCTLKIWGL